MTKVCPCDTGEDYRECCSRFHNSDQAPESALALMRSRYSAFALKLHDYLLKTQSNSSDEELKALERSNAETRWLSLNIIDHGTDFVEFMAAYSDSTGYHAIRERSSFRQQCGRLVYLNGEAVPCDPPSLPSRNDRCWCHSGNKFKRCHG